MLVTDAVTNPTVSISLKQCMFGVQLDSRTDTITILQHNPATDTLDAYPTDADFFFANDHTHIKLK
eukprot:COSAG02_NODE_414_length_22826_cov_9.001364_19_plen_65_part_01